MEPDHARTARRRGVPVMHCDGRIRSPRSTSAFPGCWRTASVSAARGGYSRQAASSTATAMASIRSFAPERRPWLAFPFGMTAYPRLVGAEEPEPDHAAIRITFSDGGRLLYKTRRKPGELDLMESPRKCGDSCCPIGTRMGGARTAGSAWSGCRPAGAPHIAAPCVSHVGPDPQAAEGTRARRGHRSGG